MNKIIYDIELKLIQQNKDIWNYYQIYTNQIKNKKDLVKLGLYCVKYCFDYNNEELKPQSQKCIELVEKWLIDSNSVTQQDLLNASYAATNAAYNAASWSANVASWSANTASYAAEDDAYNAAWAASYAAWAASSYVTSCLYWCSQIQNINMILPHQYIQILLRTTKQFNIQNYYSNHIKEIVKQDIDKLELVDYNMLLDISNEHYNIDLSDFNYDNIFSRRNLIEMIRRESDCTI